MQKIFSCDIIITYAWAACYCWGGAFFHRFYIGLQLMDQIDDLLIDQLDLLLNKK